MALGAGLAVTGLLGGCSWIENLDNEMTAEKPSARTESRSGARSTTRASKAAPASSARASDERTEIHTAQFANSSAYSWVVTLQSGSASDLGTGLGNRQTGDRVLVGPSQTRSAEVRRQPRWILTTREEPDEIVRVRVEQRTESWSPTRVFWFEILGPVPQKITITSAPVDGSLTPKLVGTGPPTPIVMVPVDKYPPADQSEAG